MLDIKSPNLQLFCKMSGEQADYYTHLLSRTPEEILECAYEYVIREKILIAMEHNDLPDKMAHILLKSDTPLRDVFQYYEKMGIQHMPDYWYAVVGKGNEMLREEFVKRRQQER